MSLISKAGGKIAALASGALLNFRLLEHSVDPGGARVPIRVVLHKNGGPIFDAVFSRSRRGITLSLNREIPPTHLTRFRWYLRCYAHWFAQCAREVEVFSVASDDWDASSDAKFAPSADPSLRVLIPDPHFYRHKGFAAQRIESEAAPNWNSRSSEIVWRGARNGQGRRFSDLQEQDDPDVIPRYRLVMKLRDIPTCDVRLVTSNAYKEFDEVDTRSGLLGDPVGASTWLQRKFAIDIDGYTNAWSNFLVRLHYGCCVLKVESQHGYQQWYYDRIRPFEHYVPVKPDMSDLLEKIDWVRSHDAEARAIAENGQAFARTLDFETGRREAVEIITANWDR